MKETMIKNHRVEIEKAKTVQERFALAVTGFAGTMLFVYIHVVIFALWIVSAGFGHDPFPFQFLTMAVSLEAIILSTLVMIGQNTQSKHADIRAELDYQVNLKSESENQDIINQLIMINRRLDRMPQVPHGHNSVPKPIIPPSAREV